jgi:hypothetical protein
MSRNTVTGGAAPEAWASRPCRSSATMKNELSPHTASIVKIPSPVVNACQVRFCGRASSSEIEPGRA